MRTTTINRVGKEPGKSIPNPSGNAVSQRFGAMALLAALLLAQHGLLAQGRGGPQQPQNGRDAAPIDLSGYWVSVVTEDWRYRMVTPSPGDYQGVPMTPEAREIADAWDPTKEAASGNVCKSYGAPVALRVPGRLHIFWEDDDTLRLDTDAGTQSRTFHFGNWTAPAGPATIQGNSVAEWERGGGRGGSTNGWLKVNTDHFTAGFLRKNGVPYSGNATLEEYFDLISLPNGDPLLVVTTVTTDPQYLRQPFIITSHFRKEADGAKWNPTACSATW